MFGTTAAALQMLDGRKLHVFIALVALRKQMPVSESDVARMIGCNRKTARTHLQSLEALGVVLHRGEFSKRPWTLSDGARQIPLPLLWQGHDGVFLENGAKHNSEGKSYPHRFTSSSSSSIEGTLKNLEEEEEIVPQVGKTYPHRQKKALAPNKPGLIKALEESGIGRNMWQKLAGLEWVTAEYVAAHTWLRRENKDPVSYQVQRMLSGDLMPVVVETAVCGACGKSINPKLGRCYCGSVKR